MVNLAEELMDFTPREMQISWKKIFPDITIEKLREEYQFLSHHNSHIQIVEVLRKLWTGGYHQFIEQYGFYDESCNVFSNHCHQCTPILGAILTTLGLRTSYLECMRIREHVIETGKREKIPPEEEPNSNMKPEFCRIKRIPYCCLEVIIDGNPFYISGKHFKPNQEKSALLKPVCYKEAIGSVRHHEDSRKSGIYLEPVIPRKQHQSKYVIWRKQTDHDQNPELFATYIRIEGK